MADLKITQLPAIVGADVHNDDVFVLVDTSADITKKITRTELQNTIELGLLDNVNITGGLINGTIIGNNAAAAITGTTITGTTLTGTALQIDNININGNAITSTAGTDLTISPLGGQQIVLDGTIVIDAGVVTGATSITSTAFTGNITGNVTSSGTSTLATVDINGGAVDGTTIGSSTASTGAFTTLSASGTSTLSTVDINAGAIDGTAIGSSSASTGAFTTLTGGNTTLTGYLRGPATFTIDPATHGDNTGSVVIAGNLTVNGTTTTVNSETLNVVDKQITVAFGAANAAAANGAGIKVDGADAILSYDSTNDRFTMNKSLASNLVGNVTGNVTGNTSGTAATVTGAAQTNITSVGTLTALTVTGEITANGGIALGDNDKATFGASDDLEIYHNGNDSVVRDAGTGDLLLAGSTNVKITTSGFGETMAEFVTNGAATLYHDNAAKIATTATGIDVTGVITTDGLTTSADVNFGDNDKAIFGTGSDLEIYHDASNSYISDTGTGNLFIKASNNLILESATGENYFAGVANGSVSLYYDSAVKIATTATGIDVTGAISATSFTGSGGEPFVANVSDTGTNVTASSEASLTLRNTSDTNNNTAGIQFKNSANTLVAKIGSQFVDAGDRTTDLFFATRANSGSLTERMRITSAGNVGIGTTVNALFNAVGGSTKLAVTGSSSSTNIAGNTDASIAIVNTDTTANNTAGLHFARADTDDIPNYAGASIVAQFLDTQATSNYPRTQLAFLTSTTANTTPSEKMRITDTGNVGIGEAAPLDKLHVYESSNSATATQLLLQNEGGNSHSAGIAFQVSASGETTAFAPKAGIVFERTGANGRGPIKFFNDVTNDTNGFSAGDERMRIDDNTGYVGIGTTNPSYPLHVSGKIYSTGVVASAGNSFELSDNNVALKRASNDMTLNTGGTERMRINSSGNILVTKYNGAAASPTESADWPTPVMALRGYGDYVRESMLSFGYANDAAYQTVNPVWNFRLAGTASATASSSATNLELLGPGDLVLGSGGSERMRINAQGRIIQNGSSAIGGAFYSHAWNSVSGPQMGLNSTDASGNAHNYFIFQREGTQRGSISVSGSATAYNTSSDYRMKENVNYTWDATARLKQLKPARFNFISDDTNTLVDGFLAHEVSSIVPEAISGAKDAMAVETRYTADDVETQGDTPSKNVGDSKTYSSTKIDPQGIDQSKLVPLLVKTIQELEARITALEA